VAGFFLLQLCNIWFFPSTFSTSFIFFLEFSSRIAAIVLRRNVKKWYFLLRRKILSNKKLFIVNNFYSIINFRIFPSFTSLVLRYLFVFALWLSSVCKDIILLMKEKCTNDCIIRLSVMKFEQYDSRSPERERRKEKSKSAVNERRSRHVLSKAGHTRGLEGFRNSPSFQKFHWINRS